MFGRLQLSQPGQLRAAADPGETGSPSNAFVHVKNKQGAVGFTFTMTPTSAWTSGSDLEHQGRQGAPGVGGPTMLELYGSPAFRPIRASRAASPNRA